MNNEKLHERFYHKRNPTEIIHYSLFIIHYSLKRQYHPKIGDIAFLYFNLFSFVCGGFAGGDAVVLFESLGEGEGIGISHREGDDMNAAIFHFEKLGGS